MGFTRGAVVPVHVRIRTAVSGGGALSAVAVTNSPHAHISDRELRDTRGFDDGFFCFYF